MPRNTKSHLLLLEGCSCTVPAYYPKNWNEARASVKTDWYIWYRFHDPTATEKYPRGKMCIVKGGVNEYTTLGERRQFIVALMADELKSIQEKHWNPVQKRYMTPPVEVSIDYIISPDLDIINALEQGYKHVTCSRMDDVRSVKKYSIEAILDIGLDTMKIKDVRTRHILMIMQQVEVNKKAEYRQYLKDKAAKKVVQKKNDFTNRTYNYYKSHLSILFAALKNVQAIEMNPVTDVKKRKTIDKLPVILSKEEKQTINERLKEDNYLLWRMMHIYYHGGSRRREILSVKGKDVDLVNQKYRTTVFKGKWREVERTITLAALPYWIEATEKCLPEQYVFGYGLVPGDKCYSCPKVLTNLWKKWVKDAYGIEVNWGSLRHSNTTETIDEIQGVIDQAIKVVAAQNQHTPSVLKKHYDMNKDRQHNILKGSTRTFS